MVNLGMAVLAAALGAPPLEGSVREHQFIERFLGGFDDAKIVTDWLEKAEAFHAAIEGSDKSPEAARKAAVAARDEIKALRDKPAPLPAAARLRALRAFVTGARGWYAVAGRLEPGDELRIAKLAREANRYVAESTASDPAAPSKEERDRAKNTAERLRRQLVLVSGDVRIDRKALDQTLEDWLWAIERVAPMYGIDTKGDKR